MPHKEEHPLVFVLDDEPSVARVVTTTLKQFQFRTEEFHTAGAFLRRLKVQVPAVAIVDLSLPDRDGLGLVSEIVAAHDCGVLILTGRDTVSDRVVGLELGAVDYLVKPFDARELVARVRSVLRRRQPRSDGKRRVCQFPGWRFDMDGNSLWPDQGEQIRLSASEARLLSYFVSHPNRILSREELSGIQDLSPADRSIDIRVSRLRNKLDRPGMPELIRTVYGAGYLFAATITWVQAVDGS